MSFDSLYAALEQLCAGRRLEGCSDVPVTALLEITGESAGCILLTADGSGIRLERRRASAGCTATLSAATAEKLLSGKLSPVAAMMTGAVRIKGDATRLMSLARYIK